MKEDGKNILPHFLSSFFFLLLLSLFLSSLTFSLSLFVTHFLFLYFFLAQLICPISFEDQSGLWNSLEENLLTRFPIRDVSCKNPINGNQIIIDKSIMKSFLEEIIK